MLNNLNNFALNDLYSVVKCGTSICNTNHQSIKAVTTTITKQEFGLSITCVVHCAVPYKLEISHIKWVYSPDVTLPATHINV